LESLKFSTTPTPQVENPSDSDSSTPTPQPWQGALGRNRSFPVGGVLRPTRIWAWQRKYKPQLKWNSARIVITLSHLASSANCLQRFFACRWWLGLLESNLQRCNVWISLFTRSGLWELTCCSCKTTEHQQQQENQITNTQTKNKTRKPNQKYTNKKKQNNQNLGKETQPRCVKNGSMYNRVKKSMK